MSYLGNFSLGDTLDFKFCTVTTTGAPTQLAGSPVVSAYPGNSTTQLTAGITLTVDFDAVTGLNHVRVVASSGNGYATATNYQLVITTGTVGGTSVVGYVVAEFSIENRAARLTSAGVDDILRTALVESYAANGAAGTLTQMLFAIQQFLHERVVVSTNMSVKKLDGTEAMAFTTDSATSPTTISRTT